MAYDLLHHLKKLSVKVARKIYLYQNEEPTKESGDGSVEDWHKHVLKTGLQSFMHCSKGGHEVQHDVSSELDSDSDSADHLNLNCLALHANLQVTAEMGFIFTANRPMKPPNSIVMMTTIIMTRPAAQGLNIRTEMTAKTEKAMITIAQKRFHLRERYCSQKVKASPEGKLGSPFAVNSSQVERISSIILTMGGVSVRSV